MAQKSSSENISPGLKFWRGTWMLSGVIGIGVVLYLVLFPPRTTASAHPPTVSVESRPAVQVQDDGSILISADTSFAARINTTQLAARPQTDPLLTVSGTVVARVLSGEDELSERWHFDTPESASAYTNWLKSNSEIVFARNILEKTKELNAAEAAFHAAQLKRLEPGANSGIVSERELLSAREELLKSQLQGQKDIFSAQSAVRVADNGRIALERELSQRGIEPLVFSRAVEHMVLVSANVPEAKISQVHEGQACRVRFYSYPDQAFHGHVETLSTTVTHELRTLRVLFDLTDPDGLLIPGMFAEVELGTDERAALLIPATALLHVGHIDYVLVETAPRAWMPQVVRVGEFRRGSLEVLQGLKPGQTIISEGTILLKPRVVESLARLNSRGS